MYVKTPEISWHGRDPIYSIDFQVLNGSIQRLATGGADKNVRIWQISTSADGCATADFLSNLQQHDKSVNCVRFSPNGQILASASDDNTVILWRRNENVLPPSANIFADEEEDNKESWAVYKILRSHLQEVYDLSWSVDSKFLLSGSVDYSAILWEVKKAQRVGIFPEAKMIVQGVAMDPQGEFLATMSNDRSCRIYRTATKNCIHNISKMSLKKKAPPPTDGASEKPPEKQKSFRMFLDDTNAFFRRLSFTPDGELLIVPSGCIDKGDGPMKNSTYVFTRYSFPKPVLHLPCASKPSLTVRCCPVLYELRHNNNEKKSEAQSTFSLPYRMIFAVATEDSVLLYDTQQLPPFALVSSIHYHTLSDLSWTHDGRMLMVSSTDGFCTIVSFDEFELGTPYQKTTLDTQAAQEISVDQGKTSKNENQHKVTTKQKSVIETEKNVVSGKNQNNVKSSESSTDKPADSQKSVSEVQPRRVQVTTLVGKSDKIAADSEPSDKDAEMSNVIGESSREEMPENEQSSQKYGFTEVKPRRVQVTTLCESKSTARNLTADSPKPRRVAMTTGSKSPARGIDEPKPRRVQVTTLSTTPKSANESPKSRRVQVTTLSTTPKSANESPKSRRVQVTTLSTSGNTTPKSDNDSVKPRRIQVTTLSTTPKSINNAETSTFGTPSSSGNRKPAKRRIEVTTLSTNTDISSVTPSQVTPSQEPRPFSIVGNASQQASPASKTPESSAKSTNSSPIVSPSAPYVDLVDTNEGLCLQLELTSDACDPEDKEVKGETLLASKDTPTEGTKSKRRVQVTTLKTF